MKTTTKVYLAAAIGGLVLGGTSQHFIDDQLSHPVGPSIVRPSLSPAPNESCPPGGVYDDDTGTCWPPTP